MKFEWDDKKSLDNKVKHGIDFSEAVEMWKDENRVEIKAPYPLEERSIMIGKIGKSCGQQYSHIAEMIFVSSQ
jgi:uncharacterized DUF497 family protein